MLLVKAIRQEVEAAAKWGEQLQMYLKVKAPVAVWHPVVELSEGMQ